jgi:hypothetical protein
MFFTYPQLMIHKKTLRNGILSYMKQLGVVIFLALILTPHTSRAQSLDYDLGLQASDVRFSGELVAGQKRRVYAAIHNHGKQDMTGYVRFYQGQEYIGDSQVVSVVAGGLPDEVFVDWIVPQGSFNIKTEIREQDPFDENPSNDSAITSLFVPLPDFDGDGSPDQDDLDDDNDGLLDYDEHQVGTDPFNPDSDGDGVSDGEDEYPLDASKSKTVIVVPQVVSSQPVVPIIAPLAPVENTQVDEGGDDEVVADEQDTADEDENVFDSYGQVLDAFISKNQKYIDVEIERENWRTYRFEPLVRGLQSRNLEYEWRFGDGEISNKPYPTHTYLQPRVYGVSLTVTDKVTGERYTSDVQEVDISFFNIGNYQLWLLLLVILIGLIIVLKILKAISKSKERKGLQVAKKKKPSTTKRKKK